MHQCNLCYNFQISGIGGCGQQHGTVYLKMGFQEKLKNLDYSQNLVANLRTSFSVKQSPIWMDSSTSKYCEEMEEAFSGPDRLATVTGSRAYCRFSAHQIYKIAFENREYFNETERIMLVSNFIPTMLTGSYIPIEYSDGSGMNLFDIYNKKWVSDLVTLYGIDIRPKLGEPESLTKFKPRDISKYFVKRYGFRSDCKISLFTGDNPSTLAGLLLHNNDIILSLG